MVTQYSKSNIGVKNESEYGRNKIDPSKKRKPKKAGKHERKNQKIVTELTSKRINENQ